MTSIRSFPQSDWPGKRGHDALFSMLRDQYPPSTHGFTIEDRGDSWLVTVTHGDADLDTDLLVQENYRALSLTYYATVTAFRVDAKPVQVQRGTYQGWCYASAGAQFLYAQGRLKVGDKVPVVFLDGDRDQPCVLA